ncbi:MAG: hypothetical protein VXY82_09425, partial [Planctomycetota bacterium]|nr:hypothetical protein [Planctomycetota bacterium]
SATTDNRYNRLNLFGTGLKEVFSCASLTRKAFFPIDFTLMTAYFENQASDAGDDSIVNEGTASVSASCLLQLSTLPSV